MQPGRAAPRSGLGAGGAAPGKVRPLFNEVAGLPARIWRSPRNRRFALAVLVGFALRLVWVIWATGPISEPLSDPAQYLNAAVRFSGLGTPTIFGQHTAFLPPGYSLFLAPAAFAARHTGWISLNFAASLLNVALGTATIVITALLARAWVGEAARNLTAWIMALAPGHIYYTSVALSETLFATMTVGVLLAATILLRDGERRRAAALVVLGLFVGWAMLVRTPGAMLLFAPALVLRASCGSWAGAARATGWAFVGTLVLLVPWTIRNAVQVGVAVPISTNNAAFMCTGHNDNASGGFDATPEGLRYCFGGSAYDEGNADEARWYGATSRRAIGWAFTHPVEEIRLTLWKTYDTMSDDREALSDAQDFGARPLVGDRVQGLLRTLANGWHWAVLAFGAAGLVWLAACRRALPLWVTGAAYLVAVWGGLALSRYHHAVMPLLAVFAAAALAAIIDAGESRPAGAEAR